MHTSPRRVPNERLSARAVVVASVLLLANSYWLGLCEMIWHNAHLTIIAVPINVAFALLMLTWVNTLARQAMPRRALRPAELITVYSMLATGSAFAGHDFMPRLMGLLPHAFRYASTENDWEALLFSYLPRWLVVSDPGAVEAFYEGETSFFGGGYWQAWATPLFWWSCVVLLLMVSFLCLTTLFREQWVSRERLAYPLIRLPYELATHPARLFRDRVFWVGFLIAFGINLWNGIQYFYPTLPLIPIKTNTLNQHFTERPWSAMGYVPLRLHPFLIGVGYLLPLDISFSVVVFYVFQKCQYIAGSAMGVRLAPGYPFLGEQGAGALLALLMVSLWTGRSHFKRVALTLTPSRVGLSSGQGHRAAATMLTVCVLCLLLICLRAGMTFWGFAAYIVTYLGVVVGLTRMRTELGPPIHAIGYATPQHLIVSAFGTRSLGQGNLTVLSMLNWLSGASYASFRTHPMPHQMEAMKLADQARIRPGSMLLALFIAGIVGIVGSLIIYPMLIYREGVPSVAEQIHGGGNDTFNFLAGWLQLPRPTNWFGMGALAASFIASIGIFAMRARYFWCPLHPAGYVIGIAPGTTDNLWFPLLIAIVIKAILLRFVGFRAYRRAMPFFIGLAAGEALMAGFWPLLSLVTRTTVYSWI
ncbi:hypothetical protein HN371_03990 [Candidatus Poribacteria bacterium]|mgnify:CR=1 FL=1|jgi:hypothetical protein|nr:hypothetical protein [Candidatus Poribacteria bacterium]MBT5532975.1 hypothetical protein [Candidatus Poribacteria bacterium]MBT5710751.1 hypothetical protein [Candidatus Poribacteria bacterium]MBT7097067.1 hypothetical protein [Candidatus Poribacteria bacterium]MBT7805204.1 hypothetical protein [Candidatus Poribacteria bacterium]